MDVERGESQQVLFACDSGKKKKTDREEEEEEEEENRARDVEIENG